ncbi:hypothetical protein L3X37_09665 [Sabulilitoribacter arenilitoris]|uniref:Alpha-L-glutamate ligase-related protein ATP-grasp domain-containing protein n=1 Tax=Wocania arenilitoris TaxID=2044858 RepID=A0AAE3EPA3_9FLAO|nr:sugar-transfer associated ATP-grasp domain-containing protein [Wocania arenilitoris]MCF7568631.1 hypothetical protein [Wocania arenilitoris]
MLSRLRHLNVFIKDKNKKGWLKIIKEIIHFSWVKKDIPSDYFRKFLYRNDVSDYTNYLTLKEYYSIINSPKIIVPEAGSILNNKLSFALFAEKNKLPTPKLISYNLTNSFFFNGSFKTIKSSNDLIAFFKDVFKQIDKSKLFLKLFNSLGGKGCILLEKNRLNEQISLHKDDLLNNCYIHQKVVIQHSDISKIYNNSINTIRIDTFIDKQKNIHVLSALMRFGAGNSFVDNASAGGFSIALDLNTNKLKGPCRQDLSKGGKVFFAHPDSNTKLDGYKIPYVTEACKLAKTASKLLPSRLIGWDIAITPRGPLIIEGNQGPSLHLTDVAYGGYCKHPIIQDILKEIKE